MTPDTVPRVPNKPKTPIRTYRASDDVYKAAQEAAAYNGEPLTDVILRALVAYTRSTNRKRDK